MIAKILQKTTFCWRFSPFVISFLRLFREPFFHSNKIPYQSWYRPTWWVLFVRQVQNIVAESLYFFVVYRVYCFIFLATLALAFGYKIAWTADHVSIETTCASALPTKLFCGGPEYPWGSAKVAQGSLNGGAYPQPLPEKRWMKNGKGWRGKSWDGNLKSKIVGRSVPSPFAYSAIGASHNSLRERPTPPCTSS